MQRSVFFSVWAFWCFSSCFAETGQPAKPRLMTRWAKDVSPDAPHPEYPRPQMVRKQWANLNGLWDYAIADKDAGRPKQFAGKILVPFCVESSLSGVARRVTAEQALWYRRTFAVPANWKMQRVLLNFEAVDWEATVWVNDRKIGSHRGGYDPFSIDITDALKPDSNELIVRVWDPTDKGSQPRGKQRSDARGIWYTPVTGIWQTVWLEPVPRSYIESLKIVPDVDKNEVAITIGHRGSKKVRLFAQAGGGVQGSRTAKPGEAIRLKILPDQLWTPETPKLIPLAVEVMDPETEGVDRVKSYFAMRKIELGKDINGASRLMLNGKPVFQFGPLDQGWWPDGLYTAPTDAALRYDLEVTKRMGFNMVRKHVKVEPRRWYYWCDRLGLLVWQDMPNGGPHARWPHDGVEIQRDAESARQFEQELKAMIDSRGNHPSIVCWVPFNEAWGQYGTERIARWVGRYDPTRLVNPASGGNDFPVGDMKDDHFYPGPGSPPVLPERAVVLGEYGGLGLPLKGHTWQDEKNWGYRSFNSRDELTAAYLKLIEGLRPLVATRLAAAVYTQTTDVESEVNGLMTYDREVIKIDVERLAAAHRTLYQTPQSLSPRQRANLTTLAWWRFEEGKPGQRVPNAKDHPKAVAARDFSGHNNHLYAFGRPQSPRHSDQIALAKIPLTGDANRGCLDDSKPGDNDVPTADLFTNPGKSKTHMDVINTFPMLQWTVEASFKLALSNHFHGLVGKDGKPTDAPHAPFQLKVRGDDNRLQIEAIDSTGQVREVRSRSAIKANQWYHAAVVSDGKRLRLFLKTGKGYVLQGEAEFTGRLINAAGTWTIGRGFYDNRIADDARAWIDEVRVSVTALIERQFLFADQKK